MCLHHVDDLMFTGSSRTEKLTANALDKAYKRTISTDGVFLGMQVSKGVDGSISLTQSGYTEEILSKCSMADCKPVAYPMQTNVEDLTLDSSSSHALPGVEYRTVVGLLLYLSTHTRPDISYAVGWLSRFLEAPTSVQWLVVKRVLRYLRGTTHLGVCFGKARQLPFHLLAYCDADFAGCVATRASTGGYLFLLGGDPIAWRSFRHKIKCLSSVESEYVTMSETAKTNAWLRQLTESVGIKQTAPTPFYADNQGAICLAQSLTASRSRIKHLALKYHFIRGEVENKSVAIYWIPTDGELADPFTKALNGVMIKSFRGALLGYSPTDASIVRNQAKQLNSSAELVEPKVDKST